MPTPKLYFASNWTLWCPTAELSDSVSSPIRPEALGKQVRDTVQLAPAANDGAQLLVITTLLVPDRAKLLMLRVSALGFVSVVVLVDIVPALK